MGKLKIISNWNCQLFIDQDFICELEANKLHKQELECGVYLVDVKRKGFEEFVSFDLEISSSDMQVLKRINFEDIYCSNGNLTHSRSILGNPDIIFYNDVARVCENGKYSFINKDSQYITDDLFDEAETMKDGFALVARYFDKDKKYTFLLPNGHIAIGMWFDEILYRSSTFVVVRRLDEICKLDLTSMNIIDSWHLEGHIHPNKPIAVSKQVYSDKKYGFISIRGVVELDFIYDYCSNFSDSGYALVERFGIRRYINQKGDVCILNTLEEIEKDNKHFMLLEQNSRYGNKYEWCGLFEYPNDHIFLNKIYRLPVYREGKWGYACQILGAWGENELKEMIPPIYDRFLTDSSRGYVVAQDGINVSIVNLINTKYANGEKKGQYVYGKIGEVLFHYQCLELYPLNINIYEWVDEGCGIGEERSKTTFENLVINISGKYGIINRNGGFICPCQYDSMHIQTFHGNKNHLFYENYIIVEKSGRYGLMSYNGSIILNIDYSEIYKEGKFLCVKEDNNKNYKLYNYNKQLFFEHYFDDIEYISYGDYYIASYQGKKGVISNEGKLIIPYLFEEIDYYYEGLEVFYSYQVTNNCKKGLYSKKGENIIPCRYDRIETISYGGGGTFGYFVFLDGKIGLISEEKVLLDCIYSSITYLDEDYLDDGIYFEVRLNQKSALFYKDRLITDFVFDSISKILESNPFMTCNELLESYSNEC